MWEYDFLPYEMTFYKQVQALSHYFIRCCAVIGGTFVVFGLLSAVATRIEQRVKKLTLEKNDFLLSSEWLRIYRSEWNRRG